jgi:endo-1,4-beta-xylanase
MKPRRRKASFQKPHQTGVAKQCCRIINYSGSFNPDGAAYLSVYGWTTEPLIEYYILENWGGSSIPTSAAVKKGSVTTDGGTYDIFVIPHIPQTSIPGVTGYQTYWSVRRNRRTSGSVNTAAHFDAWAALGLGLGVHNYQIVSTEGYYSSGSSDITVS